MSRPADLLAAEPAALADRGAEMMALVAELFPLCRSITGDGVRQTLAVLQRMIPLTVHEVPSGTPVLDWTTPSEWNMRDAYIANSRGERVVDVRASNLHLVSYSEPVRARMRLAALRPHLYTLPDRPDWIPYRTSYYTRSWGFCLRHRDYLALPDDEYEVVIDTTLAAGHLTYGELFLAGESADEVLLTTHVCHPSLANDNLSGIAVLAHLARALAAAPRRRLSYRILFIPGTIGAIAWLARNRDRLARIRHGLVIAGVGDRGAATYKRSRHGDAAIDRAMRHVLATGGGPHRILDFSPYGYDERQFASPGFDLPVGRFSRSEHGTYPEYHTSADDLSFVSASSLADSQATIARVLAVLEDDATFVNRCPFGEPELGRRGLYGGTEEERMALLWVLNQSDGRHSLLAIAERAGLPFPAIARAAAELVAAELLAPEFLAPSPHRSAGGVSS
jgi:aminopeptidase-like protein